LSRPSGRRRRRGQRQPLSSTGQPSWRSGTDRALPSRRRRQVPGQPSCLSTARPSCRGTCRGSRSRRRRCRRKPPPNTQVPALKWKLE
jgi:hypothetical protein